MSFERNKWYKLVDHGGFISRAYTINSAIAEYIADKPFMVVAFNSDADPEVVQISYDGKNGLTRQNALPHFRTENWSDVWFTSEEIQFFEEVPEPGTKPKALTELPKNLIIVVSGSVASNYGETGDYVVGGATPTLFDEDKAKEHIKFILEGNNPATKVSVFKLDSTASIVSTIKIEKV